MSRLRDGANAEMAKKHLLAASEWLEKLVERGLVEFEDDLANARKSHAHLSQLTGLFS